METFTAVFIILLFILSIYITFYKYGDYRYSTCMMFGCLFVAVLTQFKTIWLVGTGAWAFVVLLDTYLASIKQRSLTRLEEWQKKFKEDNERDGQD